MGLFQALLASTDDAETERLLGIITDFCITESESSVRAMFSLPSSTTDVVYLSRLFGDVPIDKISAYTST